MTLTQPLETFGSVASLFTAIRYQENVCAYKSSVHLLVFVSLNVVLVKLHCSMIKCFGYPLIVKRDQMGNEYCIMSSMHMGDNLYSFFVVFVYP